METSSKFSKAEIVFTAINCVIAKLFLIFPSVFPAISASSAVILALFTVLSGFMFVYLTSFLYNNKKTDIIRICKNAKVKTALSLLFIFTFIINQSIFVRSVAESLKISLLPGSPLMYITIIFMTGVFICAYTGLKSIIRVHSLIVPFTIFMAFILYIYSTKGFDFYNIFPILGNGPDKFLYSISLSGYFSDFIIISFLLPFTKEKTNYCKIVKPSFIVSSVMLVITVAVYILTVPYNTKVSFFIPVYRIAQYIDYGSFISRLESIFTISWILCFFAYSALQLYIMSMIAGRIFLSINNRPAIAFFAIIITIFSLLPSNTAQLVKISKLFEIPRLTVFIILPIVILLSAYRKEVKK